MKQLYQGACMCRRILFSFDAPPRFVADCVCDSCRRAHGAAAVTWVGVDTNQFRIDSGKETLDWYRSSDASERGFCAACGTRFLFRSSKWPGEIHMAVACIETPHDLVSTGVVFGEEFPPWTALVAPVQDG